MINLLRVTVLPINRTAFYFNRHIPIKIVGISKCYTTRKPRYDMVNRKVLEARAKLSPSRTIKPGQYGPVVSPSYGSNPTLYHQAMGTSHQTYINQPSHPSFNRTPQSSFHQPTPSNNSQRQSSYQETTKEDECPPAYHQPPCNSQNPSTVLQAHGASFFNQSSNQAQNPTSTQYSPNQSKYNHPNPAISDELTRENLESRSGLPTKDYDSVCGPGLICRQPQANNSTSPSMCPPKDPRPPCPPPKAPPPKVGKTRTPCKAPPPPPPPPPPSNNLAIYGILVALAGLGLTWWSGLLSGGKKGSDGKQGKSALACLRAKSRVPDTSKDIPKEVPYLLIGGGTASFSAFRAIKSHDPTAKVLVITNEIEMPYMRPPLSKELWFSPDSAEKLKFKQWNGTERSLFYEPDDFYVSPTKLIDSPNGGVAIVKGYTVKKLDVCSRKAILTDGTEIKYGECLIATGSTPKNLDIFQSAPWKVKEKITLFKTIEDFERLKCYIDKAKSVAVIGGGFLGSELACALAKYGDKRCLKVYQIFHENGNMGKVLPDYLSRWTTAKVKEEGVCIINKSQVKAVDLMGTQLKLTLIDGKDLFVDHVIVAIGTEANTSLAKHSNLEVDSKMGGYVVNAELEARRHVFVAGDASCFYDPMLGRRRVEHHDHAVVSGRLAGENMVGMKKPYRHQSMFWSDLGPNVGYEAIGIVDSSLPTVGVFAKSDESDTPKISGGTALERQANVAANGGNADQDDENQGSTETKVIRDDKPDPECEPDDKTIANSSSDDDCDDCRDPSDDYDFGKGVVFYLKDDKIVGIVLWNVFNRINTARKIINEGKKYEDLNEVAKLFEIHS